MPIRFFSSKIRQLPSIHSLSKEHIPSRNVFFSRNLKKKKKKKLYPSKASLWLTFVYPQNVRSANGWSVTTHSIKMHALAVLYRVTIQANENYLVVMTMNNNKTLVVGITTFKKGMP